jgi:major intracellular serine protease
MDSPVYKLPPIKYGAEIYLANQIKDVLDWGFHVQGIEQAWVTKGKGITIGVADTGLPNHPDLQGAIINAKNFSQSINVNDRNGHSTHVCGTIGARENGHGVIGVAPLSRIVIAKVLGDDGSGSIDGIAAGINWLVDQGVDIISMSLGGSGHQILLAAIRRAVERGVFVICAAGNDNQQGMEDQNTVGYPAKYAETVAVASYNKAGRLSDFSSRGDEVDIACPGENILSTWLNGTYRRLSGTSMATPFCSGMVAELIAQQRKADNDGRPVTNHIRNNTDLLAHLKETALDKGPIGYDRGWGWGIVDTKKFYAQPSTPVPTPETPTPPDGQRDLDLGLVRLRYPVTTDGKKGWFIYIP